MKIRIIGNPKDVEKWLGTKETPLTSYIKKALELGEKGEEPAKEDAPTFTGTILSVEDTNKETDGKSSDMSDVEYNTTKRMYIRGVANEKILDRMDEIVNPVGLDARSYLRNPVLLVDHMYMTRTSVGQVTELRPEDDGVHFEGWVGDPEKAPLTEVQKDVRSLIAQGILKTVSIGFIPKKIKAPMFNDDGKLVEPAIIEEWEMLELSVVPVPANAGSVFEMKKLQENYVKHLNKFATLWNNDNVTFEPSSKSLNVSNNASKEVIKNNGEPNEGNTMDEKQLQELMDAIKSLVTLSTSSNEMLKRSLELSESLLAKSEKKPSSEEDDKEDEEDKEKGKDSEGVKSSVEDRVKCLEDGMFGINETLGKLSESVLALVEKNQGE